MSVDPMQGLTAFVRVVEAGSFTAGARLLETTPSAISKSMVRLERRLGVRLIHRSTRSMALTAEGQAYFDRVAPLVHAVEDAAEALDPESMVKGTLKVSMPGEIGRALLEPVTRDFQPRFPNLRIEASLSDRHVDLIREGFDIVVRAGQLEDSELIARLLGRLQLVLVASPAYLDRHGHPGSVEALRDHTHVRYRLSGAPFPLQLSRGEPMTLPLGAFDADDGEACRTAATSGLGILQILHRTVANDLAEGRLHLVLPNVALAPVSVFALHSYSRAVPARLRHFLDFAENTLSVWQSGELAPRFPSHLMPARLSI
jgi:DNA-binding transcriptional LysR family regulator